MKTQYSFIIDFSFDGEKLSIFELGDFFSSSLKRLDRLRREEGNVPLKEEYMASCVQHILMQFILMLKFPGI